MGLVYFDDYPKHFLHIMIQYNKIQPKKCVFFSLIFPLQLPTTLFNTRFNVYVL